MRISKIIILFEKKNKKHNFVYKIIKTKLTNLWPRICYVFRANRGESVHVLHPEKNAETMPLPCLCQHA